MARGKLFYLPGQTWHITHRCHNRKFLLRFTQDKKRWLFWLFQARKKYGLNILNYIVTSNHVHLLVCDGKKHDTIPKSMNLVEGCIAREFNRRKKRSGAFWEDNYHATAVQTGKHLIQCMLYIDLNMVRAGVVKRPDDWSYSGYNEIFYGRQRYRLIDTNELMAQLGFPSLTAYKHIYKSWISEAIQNCNLQRERKWTECIAIGSKDYVANMKSKLDSIARNREIIGTIDTYMLK